MRLFFALWPELSVRHALDTAAAEMHALCGGRRTRADTLHLTLVFIGDLAASRLPLVLAAAGEVAARKFEMCFDRPGCWRHNRIAHLGCNSVPPGLRDLVGVLETRLDAAGIAFDRRAYVPHITLVRKADCALQMTNPAPAPIRWPARDFVLVSSSLRSGGALYEQLGRWPLL